MSRPSARSPARVRKRSAGRFELGRLICLPGGTGEVECRRVVVGEHVGDVLDPAGGLPLEPARGRDMPGGARGAGELPVGDVADEDVAERVLVLAVDRGSPCGGDELTAGKLGERRADSVEVAVAHRRHSTRPEDLPDHGGVGEKRLHVGVEGVETGRDQRLHRLRERHLDAFLQPPCRTVAHDQVAVFQQPYELLRKERVAAGAVEDRLLQLRREHRRLEQAGERARGLLARERLEVDRVAFGRPAA